MKKIALLLCILFSLSNAGGWSLTQMALATNIISPVIQQNMTVIQQQFSSLNEFYTKTVLADTRKKEKLLLDIERLELGIASTIHEINENQRRINNALSY